MASSALFKTTNVVPKVVNEKMLPKEESEPVHVSPFQALTTQLFSNFDIPKVLKLGGH